MKGYIIRSLLLVNMMRIEIMLIELLTAVVYL